MNPVFKGSDRRDAAMCGPTRFAGNPPPVALRGLILRPMGPALREGFPGAGCRFPFTRFPRALMKNLTVSLFATFRFR